MEKKETMTKRQRVKETKRKRKKFVDEDKENVLWLEWEIPLPLSHNRSCFGRPTVSLSNGVCLWGFRVGDLSKLNESSILKKRGRA